MDFINKQDGSPAYKVIDGDNWLVERIFHNEHREKVLDYYKNLGKYQSVSEDCDGDIICFREAEDED